MKAFTDQMGRTIQLEKSPEKIISLVPSQTELLFHLGLENKIVGLTKFCVHPKGKVQSKTRIGGTKKYNFEKIRALTPDLIIGNKEENEQAQIEALEKEFLVWMSDIETLENALEMIEKIGGLTNKTIEAEKLTNDIKSAFEKLTNLTIDNPKPTTAYFIWRKPYMVAASETFIHEMLKKASFKNLFETQNRYPETTLEQLQTLQPEVILLSSEPFPFSDKHIEEFREICPKAVIRLVDGEFFSWYGSRLLSAPPYFAKLRGEVLNALKDS